MLEHVRLVLDGRVSPLLLWEKHPVLLVATAFLALALLLMMKRLLVGTRPKIVVQQPGAPWAQRPELVRARRRRRGRAGHGR